MDNPKPEAVHLSEPMHIGDLPRKGASSSGWLWIALAAALAVPGIVVALGSVGLPPPARALVFGVAIIGAAFLLSWAAEAVQIDFSQGMALALLALIAILPEYVVDATFAWLAAEDPAYGAYAIANMTGANRLLIGVAWPLVVIITFLRFGLRSIKLDASNGLETVVLLVATCYAFVLPLRGSLTLIDMGVLVSLFGLYLWQVARQAVGHPHLVGPALLVGSLPTVRRRLVTAALGLGAAIAVLLVAKPFATALVATGKAWGVDEFLLVQWLAPLASEAPEFVVVALFAWRGAAAAALGTLVSSKVNQWTLLVAMLPLVYSVALGRADSLVLDERQRGEVLLTAAQSLFAVSLLLNLRLSVVGAGALFVLFVTQMVLPETRLALTYAYVVLAALVLLRTGRGAGEAFRWMRAQPRSSK